MQSGKKFGIHVGGLNSKANIKVGVNLINIEGVIRDFMNKTKSNFCYTYRVNRLS